MCFANKEKKGQVLKELFDNTNFKSVQSPGEVILKNGTWEFSKSLL